MHIRPRSKRPIILSGPLISSHFLWESFRSESLSGSLVSVAKFGHFQLTALVPGELVFFARLRFPGRLRGRVLRRGEPCLASWAITSASRGIGTGVRDFDEDGVETEFTVGQVSALTVYQASLPPPRRIHYRDRQRDMLAAEGERCFSEIGCAACHRPSLPLRSAWFFEPNPYNRPGSVIPSDVVGQIAVPLQVESGTGVYPPPKARP